MPAIVPTIKRLERRALGGGGGASWVGAPQFLQKWSSFCSFAPQLEQNTLSLPLQRTGRLRISPQRVRGEIQCRGLCEGTRRRSDRRLACRGPRSRRCLRAGERRAALGHKQGRE